MPREVLERAALLADFPLFLLDPLLRLLGTVRLVLRGKTRPDRLMSAVRAVELMVLFEQAADVLLEPLARPHPKVGTSPVAKDREEAAALWARLEGCSSAERRGLVEELEEFWSWALCERVAAESIKQAPNHPNEALELAELALLVAEQVSGEWRWRSRLKGYALLFVANARRACLRRRP